MSNTTKEFLFGMTSPCSHCPFRNDIHPFIRPDRAKELANTLKHKTFACHETVYRMQQRGKDGRFLKKTQHHCAGALIVMHKSDAQGDLQQIAERLGMYDRAKLKMDAPVYDSMDDFVEAHCDSR